jgi:alpha-ribazole phosphatase
MKLWLVRHAKPGVAEGLCYGRADVPVPLEATRAVAQSVAPLLPAGVEMRCSPLSRCADLAQALIDLRPDLRMTADPRIAEMDFGEWEQRPWPAIDPRELDAWTRDFADTRAGRSGESTRQFLRRVAAAFDAWHDDGRDAVWITHAGVIRAVWLLRDGLRVVERADQWPKQAIGFGECVTVECGGGF